MGEEVRKVSGRTQWGVIACGHVRTMREGGGGVKFLVFSIIWRMVLFYLNIYESESESESESVSGRICVCLVFGQEFL